jgi:hypothetical protein
MQPLQITPQAQLASDTIQTYLDAARAKGITTGKAYLELFHMVAAQICIGLGPYQGVGIIKTTLNRIRGMKQQLQFMHEAQKTDYENVREELKGQHHEQDTSKPETSGQESEAQEEKLPT